MFQRWQPLSYDERRVMTVRIRTQYGVYAECVFDHFNMTLCLTSDRTRYHKPTLNGKPLSREDFNKFCYYEMYASMIRCHNPHCVVIWLKQNVSDSDCPPGETLRIVMQQVGVKRKADDTPL